MKKLVTKIWKTQKELDLEILKCRKYASAKSKLDWLQSALEFARECTKSRQKPLKHGKN